MADNFIDSNILIYSYSSTEPNKREKSLNILRLIDSTTFSTQVINEFIWVMNHKYKIELTTLRSIVDNIYKTYRITNIDHSIIDKAITLAQQYKMSYWDSLIVASALKSNCSVLFTEDMQHKMNIDKKLKIINPFV